MRVSARCPRPSGKEARDAEAPLVLAHPLDWLRSGRWVPIGVLGLANILLFAYVTSPLELLASPAVDLRTMQRGAALAGDPALYEYRSTSTFVWSPLAAYALQPLKAIDPWAWRAILVVGALAMPTWPARLAVLTSWPFWMDIATGNVLTLIFLATVWALRGSPVATWAFFTLALLRPMPLLIPAALWMLWKRPEWRTTVAGMVAVHVALVLWTGFAVDWLVAVAAVGPEIQSSGYNFSPTRWLGWWWMPIGVPLAWWLFRRGHAGWAGLAVSPYVWAYYLLWVLPWVNRSNVPPSGQRPHIR